MSRLYIAVLAVAILAQIVLGRPGSNGPYEKYLISKKLTLLEWNLVKVNLKLGEQGCFVEFDKWSQLFETVKFIDTLTLSRTSPKVMKKLLWSIGVLVSSVIGSEFPEFKQGGEKDLEIKFLIGDRPVKQFASYKSGEVLFSKEYYDFRKGFRR